MSRFFENVLRPILFRLDAERAHELGLKAMELGLVRSTGFTSDEQARIDEILGPIVRFRLKFNNPLGIAAGFDKNGKVVDQLSALGFGFVEVGTVTYEPQPGNPKPRLFRLPEDKALINRLGFNNDGAVAVAERLQQIERRCVVGVNIGRNKNVDNEHAVENYLRSFDAVHAAADYIVVNVSSPNTPNLRELQSAQNLEFLLGAIQYENRELATKPLLVKIAPDISEGDIESIVGLCLRFRIDGIIATNTTTERNGLRSRDVGSVGAGGLSGRPLADRSTQVIRHIYKYSKAKLPIVGVGGILSAEDAFEKIAAGASLVQAYTGFIYSGPTFPVDVVRGVAEIIKERGFKSLDDAVGSAVK